MSQQRDFRVLSHHDSTSLDPKKGPGAAWCYQARIRAKSGFAGLLTGAVVANRTSKGCFVKGHSGNPAGRPKRPPEFAPNTDYPAGAGRRTVGNLVVEARKFSGLAVDTLVELTKDNYAPSTRYVAATALLDRGYGRPAQSLDLHLSADAITKRLSDMTDAELAALEARMITVAPIVLEATAEVSDDAAIYRTATSRIPRRMPLPDSAPTQNSFAASPGV